MAMLTGYMQRYTRVKTIGLCHSVQCCSKDLLKGLGMEDKLEGRHDPAIIHRARAVVDAALAVAVADMLTVRYGTDYLA